MKVLLVVEKESARPMGAPFPPASQFQPVRHANRVGKYISIAGRDVAVLRANINGGCAMSEIMICVFADQLQNPNNHGDIEEVFRKTHAQMELEYPQQVPEIRSTLKHKLSLEKIFIPHKCTEECYIRQTE